MARLLLVASDRISAFDVVLPTEIPDKGRVLTGLSRFWFAETSGIVRNHLLDTDPTIIKDALDIATAEPQTDRPPHFRIPRSVRYVARSGDDLPADRSRPRRGGRPRLPGRVWLEGIPGGRCRLRRRRCPRACARAIRSRSRSSRRPRRRSRANTTRTSTSTRWSSTSAATGCSRRTSRADRRDHPPASDRALPLRNGDRRARRDRACRHEVRVRHRHRAGPRCRSRRPGGGTDRATHSSAARTPCGESQWPSASRPADPRR